nr:hypothetical protein CFP56_00522 [Quercus suber]
MPLTPHTTRSCRRIGGEGGSTNEAEACLGESGSVSGCPVPCLPTLCLTCLVCAWPARRQRLQAPAWRTCCGSLAPLPPPRARAGVGSPARSGKWPIEPVVPVRR